MIYTDVRTEVHEGDTVRYTCYDWRNRGKFYGMTGRVVEVLPNRPGAVGIHFPHYAAGVNVLATAGDLRMVACPHEGRRYGPDTSAWDEALRLNRLFDLDVGHYGHVAAWNRAVLGLPELKEEASA